MERRLKKHKRVLTSGNTAQSGAAEHTVDQMHEINGKEAEVVDSHSYYLEMRIGSLAHLYETPDNEL